MFQHLGPIILDLKTIMLDQEERDILQHPLVAGVILFSRNYESPSQIAELCRSIRSVRSQPIIIAVDHEGGRVQRFRQGFSHLPPMQQIGIEYSKNPQQAMIMAEACGWIMAAELFSIGVNLSFAPVLDLAMKNHSVIGDRAFDASPSIVVKLAKALIKGMHEIGMASTGKHFPGHGEVTLDSHKTLPIDERDFALVEASDMVPFRDLIQENVLDAVMPAHILFPKMSDKPVGFSDYWLQEILRKKLQFNGIVFSDDLNMEGAAFAGNYVERATLALNAGCDLVLICNNRLGAIQILDQLPHNQYLLDDKTVKILLGRSFDFDYTNLLKSRLWKEKTLIIRKKEVEDANDQ